MREKFDGGVVMAHGLEGGVERERLRTMVAMASISSLGIQKRVNP